MELRTSKLRPASVVAFFLASCGGARQPAVLDSAGATTSSSSGPATAQPAQPSRPGADHRTAIDLYANRVHASLHRDGRLVVDAGSVDFLKYVDGGWKTSWILGGDDGGRPAALVANLSGTMFLPVDTDGDGAAGAALGEAGLV